MLTTLDPASCQAPAGATSETQDQPPGARWRSPAERMARLLRALPQPDEAERQALLGLIAQQEPQNSEADRHDRIF